MMNEIEEHNKRGEMIEYLKQAIGEGYQPEHENAVSDPSVFYCLNDGDLNREFGKCWQWYNMGGGAHENFHSPFMAKEPTQAERNQQRAECIHVHKLQCLSSVLEKNSGFDKAFAEHIAEAINAAFDKITY